MTVINTNFKALVAAGALNNVYKAMSKAMAALSTGSQLTSSANNAAGSAILNRMTAQIQGLNQAVKNVNDGINMLQTADGATNAIVTMLQRMRELAVQAANGTNGSNDISNINSEFSALKSQITIIANSTTWNGISILNSSSSISFTLQVGANSSATGNQISISISGFTTTALGVSSLSLTSTSAASTALDILTTALNTVGTDKANLGADIKRLNYTADNLIQIATNVAQSKSAIADTDYSTATAESSRAQIIKQARQC